MEGSLWNGDEFPRVQPRCANVQMIRVESAVPPPNLEVASTYFALLEKSIPAQTYSMHDSLMLATLYLCAREGG